MSVFLYGNTGYLEVVESHDADSCINALQSFIDRIGKPYTLVPDCGSNFKRATQNLSLEHPKLNQDKITNFTDQQSAKWKFNPPSLPHMGVHGKDCFGL